MKKIFGSSNKNLNKILSCLSLVIVFVTMLILNLKTLYVADDYVYRFFYKSPSPLDAGPVINTFSIPSSMYHHYMLWNGRFVAHSIVQFFMQFDSKVIFDIFNSLAMIALILLLGKTVSILTNKKIHWWELVTLFVFLWFAIPAFGQTVLWLSGAGNYLWMSLIYLGLIYLALKIQKASVINLLIAVVLGFLAGATNENSGPASLVIIFLFAVWQFIKSRKINWFAVVSCVFGLLGFLTMFLSPGSQLRGSKPHLSLMESLTTVRQMTVHQYKWFYLILILLLIVGLVFKKVNWDILIKVIIFMIGHVLSIFVLIMSPEFPLRTMFGATVFLAVATFLLIFSIFDEMQLKASVPLSVILLIVFAISYKSAYQDINHTYQGIKVQYQMIENAKEHHRDSVNVPLILTPKSDYNAYKGTLLMEENHQAWMNMWVAKYFGIKQVSGYFK